MIVIHLNNENYKTILTQLGVLNEINDTNVSITDYVEKVYKTALENGIILRGGDEIISSKLEYDIMTCKNKCK